MNDVSEQLSFFAALYQVDQNPEAGMWQLYVTIFILSAIVYKLGFAKRLPLLKNVIIYFFLALGCTLLTFFGVFLPVGEGLVVAILILAIYKIRLWRSKKEQQIKKA
ncbi:YlaH-like family protein [Bacillus sp. CLL-7-23]|uniref:YlaH-like family protein n=1 Tax=Bacillus changyiensis TaxID=3004103 RepID=A0ABT4X2J0_9BACI|nr:YlaH-like family protein [Bacillus changyiensis]MDA7026322.1 YlaH-like family protein [Bacillus changyiensis]